MSMIGKTLAHYEITSQLGKGGMGEVYQAKDRKLGRDVAIKVLPEAFARDADRVARFQREAKLLASLNHPNIAAIYGLEESGGTQFLVLELVEGDTLADQIKKGPIPTEESLKLALQIAEALEAAHEKGVIHRDLKPANIKVTPDGKVKVLDFGLAKAFAGEQAELNLSNSPTLSDAATLQGVILGTAAYMSPEQAKGKAVDRRADIWAFGVVLFEMLTGRQVFTGETVSDTLASVLAREPKWQSLPSNLHPRIRLLLERCLKKEPKDRYGVINDARVDIQEVLADPSGVLMQPGTAVEPRGKLRAILPWAAATLVLGAIIAGVAIWKLRPPEPRQVMRFSYELPEKQQFSNLQLDCLAVSPDGKQIVYSSPDGLFLRTVDELEARHISGTKNASGPFFSPDGQWIGYFSADDGKLKKIPVSGGAPVDLCNAMITLGARWNADDTIIYCDYGKGILRVSANGGNPEVLVKPQLAFLASPQMLPDGKTLLYGHVMPDMTNQIVMQSLESGERKVLFPGATLTYLSTGHIIYGAENNLFAVPFDVNTLKITGSPVSVIQGVFRLSSGNLPHYAASEGGTLAFIPGPMGTASPTQRILVWVDRKGNETPLPASANDYSYPRLSPDGTKLALAVGKETKNDIWIWDTGRETMTRLTFNESSSTPLWTLDGRRIAFTSGNETQNAIFWKSADGTGEDEKLGSMADRVLAPWSWSKDGKTLVTIEIALGTGAQPWDIGTLSMEGDHKRMPLLQGKYTELQPEISPDGRWIAYMSSESGKSEIYVRPFPEVNKGRWQVSTGGGHSPLWSRDGRELFYRSADSAMAVAVQTEPAFEPGKPEVLFRGTYVGLSLSDAHPWDISPDGKRFLMMKAPQLSAPAAAGGPRKINIVLNWLEELKQRVPTK